MGGGREEASEREHLKSGIGCAVQICVGLRAPVELMEWIGQVQRWSRANQSMCLAGEGGGVGLRWYKN